MESELPVGKKGSRARAVVGSASLRRRAPLVAGLRGNTITKVSFLARLWHPRLPAALHMCMACVLACVYCTLMLGVPHGLQPG